LIKKRIYAIFPILAIVCTMLAGCGSDGLDPKNPVAITMWHNYGGQMQSTMDSLVDEFNNTIGREKGIIVNVTAISAFKDVETNLQLIANGDPGAPEMPDITVAYPKTAMFLQSEGLLAPLDELFTKEELNTYLPEFIAEGRLSDGQLYVFPIAKSTEVLFVNQTLFERFAADTGVTMDSLATFEGIAEAAVQYTEWSGGAAFYTADSWFNIAMVGAVQKGAAFVEENRLRTDLPSFKNLWTLASETAAQGGFAMSDSYSSDLSKTGEIICSTGSTAGILFYGESVTYPDNTIEAVEYTVLPYPTFVSGSKVALQRGAGMVIAKSTSVKEYAAALFLKWVTQPEQNMRFVSSTGYLPVTKEAFESNMTAEIEKVENANIRRLLTAAIKMYDEYSFIVAPNYEQYDTMSKAFESAFKQSMREARERVDGGEEIDAVTGALYSVFMK